MNDMQSVQGMVMLSGDQVMTDSRRVAEHFGKRHKNVLQSIRRLLNQLPEGGRLNFQHTPCIDSRNGETYDAYQMTKDGFMLLVMGFTGEKALQVKLAFIEAFNRMAEFIQGQVSGAWERWNAAWLEYRHEKDQVSQGAKFMRRWQDRKPEHHQRLRQLDPQLCLFAALN